MLKYQPVNFKVIKQYREMLPAAHWMGESAETELSGLNDTSSEIMNIESLPLAMFMLQHWYLLVHQNNLSTLKSAKYMTMMKSLICVNKQ